MRKVYEDEAVTLWHGDCRDFEAPACDLVLADPPYQQTSLKWDRWPDGWPSLPTATSMWCFGSLRMFTERIGDFTAVGWRQSQDVVWEKHNGSGSAADRFRRVHEQAVHFYRGKWEQVYKSVVTTSDAVARTVRRKQRPPHWGDIGQSAYESHDGGPRQMRSVIFARSCHGHALHPTQKPYEVLAPLIEYSAPVGGLVYVPFGGSGSELETARFLGRRAVGVEADQHWCDVAARRLEDRLVRQQELIW